MAGVVYNPDGSIKSYGDTGPAQAIAEQYNTINGGQVGQGVSQGGTPIGFNAGLSQYGALADQNLGQQARLDQAGQRSTAVNDIIAQRQRATEGFSAPEMSAMRDSAVNQAQQTGNANLAQVKGSLAANGVRGGAAVGANIAANSANANNMAGVNRQLLLDQAQQQRQGLNDYQSTIQGQEATEYKQLQTQLQTKLTGADQGQQNALAIQQILAGDRGAQYAGNAGGGSVICTELLRQGKIPYAIYLHDAAYGEFVLPRQVVKGYQLWARPTAKLMRKSRLLTALLTPIGRAWAYEMAYLRGGYHKSTFVGRFLLKFGVPVCRVIGKVA